MAGRTGRIASRRAPGMSDTTIIHFYRAEVARSTDWRDRLDTTSNWAITATVAVISFAFTNRESPHFTLLVGVFAVFMFLWIEARRYRYYDIWARRVRLVEHGYLLPLARREPVSTDFFAQLATEFAKPRLRISGIESLAFRMRRTYAFMLAGLLVAWVVKLDLDPVPATSFSETIRRAHIGVIPGPVVAAVWLCMALVFLWLLFLSGRAPLPSTELRAPTRKGRPPLGEIFRGVYTRYPLP
ncbi:MAG TPA: DUF2270 domain-containing protein [Vulgatibacter sp.]